MTKTTTRPNIRIHDLSTNEIIDRPMNDQEFDQWKLDQVNNDKLIADRQAQNLQRAVILDRLGLTVDELKLLLG